MHPIGNCRKQQSFRPWLELLRCAGLHERRPGRRMRISIEHTRRAGGGLQGLSEGKIDPLQSAMFGLREHPEKVAEAHG